MAEQGGALTATREAVQPSLWDRLLNDLPGAVAEIEELRRALARELRAERLEALVVGGTRAVAADQGLRPAQRESLTHLQQLELRRAELETRGIVVSPDVLREAVRRDIEALLGTPRFDSCLLLTDRERADWPDTPLSLADFPEVRRSVVNYGVPSFAGRSSRDFNLEALARELEAVLAAFEPRLKESATKVTVKPPVPKATALSIEIDSLLVMAPAPERLRLRTSIDLETGLARTSLREP